MSRPSLLRVTELTTGAATPFELRPDASACESLCQKLGLSALRKVRFVGEVAPVGGQDWRLSATLGATLVQPCVVTLEPVTTRIDVPVDRLFVADFAFPDDSETEMPEDDNVEPLPDEIDLAVILEEALALHVPLYPRHADAELDTTIFAGPGVAPLTDEASRPFADLAALRDKMNREN